MEAMGPNVKIAVRDINVEDVNVKDVREAKLMATVFWHLGISLLFLLFVFVFFFFHSYNF